MKILYGSSRIAIVVGSLVFKIPKYGVIMDIPKALLAKSARESQSRFKAIILQILRGLISNLTEYAMWTCHRSSALAPVYFSVGFFSIQKYIHGTAPSWDELVKCFRLLSPQARSSLNKIDRHSLAENNFTITSEGIVMTDYGDNILSSYPGLNCYFAYHMDEFEAALKNPPD